MSRFGEPIEMDLVDRGIDLAEHWRRRRWRRLLNIIDRLPPSSHYGDALADDDEYAQLILDAEERTSGRRSTPRVRDWTTAHDLQAQILDRLGELITVTVAVHGGKAKVPPTPRPRTAADRLRDRRQMEQFERLRRKLLGDRAGVEA